MATPAADRAVLDTNVLLAATDESRAEHERAVAALDEWPDSGMVLYTSGQIMREYLVVATRPVAENGLGLEPADVIANVRALLTRLTVMPEGAKVTSQLLRLLERVRCRGKQIHDANVVATMLVHGVDTIATSNVRDFARFSDDVAVVDLLS